MKSLLHESGQATAEYSLLTLLVVGGGIGLLGFAPGAMAAWQIYVGGFWLVLGLPIP